MGKEIIAHERQTETETERVTQNTVNRKKSRGVS